ncbi:hypothetical protein CBL_12782 [Carabus blaptoides fortunei]
MDSFLEEPRSTPKPTPVIQEISAPTVPEVSLMFQNARKDRTTAPVNMNIGKPMQSYNAWKLRSSPNNNTAYDSFIMPNTGNKENISTVQQLLEDKSLLSKKQVRFESPVPKNGDLLQYPSGRQNMLKMKKLPETCVEKVIESKPMTRHDVLVNKSSDKMNTCTQAASVSKPFEKLYVSNIPNRELDLSFLEPAKTPYNFIRTNTVRPVLNSPVSVNRMTPIDYNTNATYNRHSRPVLNDTTLSRNVGYYHTESVRPPARISSEPLTRNAAVPYQEILAEVRREQLAVSDRQIRADNEVLVNRFDNDSASNQTTSVCTDVNTATMPAESVQTEQTTLHTAAPPPSTGNPSMSDLLQIIKLQNEQLQMLQTQVDKLVKLNLKSEENKQHIVRDEHEHVVTVKDQQVGTSFVEDGQRKMVVQQESIEQKNNKISVGMMTSFEVSFKPPVTKKKVKQRNIQPMNDAVSSNDVSFYETVRHRARPRRKQQQQQQQQEFVPQNSKKQQENFRVFPESWKRPQETEYSLGSQESVEVEEPPESPENSIHIDMQEYDTDTDDEYSMDPGWTFCRDIVGQVNNMYTPAHQESYRARKHTEVQATDTTLHCIKQATLQHLQNDGFVQANGTDGPLKPNDISFAVKQLLMKYLPDDGLMNAVNKNTHETHNHQQQQQQQQRKPTDVSVATFKYTQQYNVVTNPPPAYHGNKGHKVKPNPTKRPAQRNMADPKILDITTIKQQPKLL